MNDPSERALKLERAASVVPPLGKPHAVMAADIRPPCSSAMDAADDMDAAGVLLLGAVLALTREGPVPLFKKVARIHRASDGSVYVLQRAPVDQFDQHWFRQALQRLSGGLRRGEDVHFVHSGDLAWRRVWKERAFKAEADPLGPDAFL